MTQPHHSTGCEGAAEGRGRAAWVAGGVLTGALLLAGCAHLGGAFPGSRLAYPIAPQTNQVDDYHGMAIADPYRPLEDDNAPATKAWTEAENRVTFACLSGIPERARIQERLKALWNYERFSVPFKRGGRYFYAKNDGLQNQSVLYTLTALTAPPRVLLDPNSLSADGTIALSGYAPSEDGHYLAYGLATAGSDWQEWRVRDTRTGQDLADMLKWVKFSGADWTPDNLGFFYSRYDEPKPGAQLTGLNYFQKLYYHRLGTPQSEDRLAYHRPDHKEWGFQGTVTDDGHYLVVSVSRGTDPKNGVFFQDLRTPGAPMVELLNQFDASYAFVDNDGSRFWFLTDLDAPRSRLIAIDVDKPARGEWRELIPQSRETLTAVHALNNQFVANYLEDAHTRIKRFDLAGKPLGELPLPGIGSAGGFGGKRSDTETFYFYTSFNTPSVIHRYDLPGAQSAVFRQPKVAFNPEDYETTQVFYQSKDGTRIPMFISAKKGLKLDGRNPTYLYGYGGFNISLTPNFSSANLLWMEMGGVYAQPNLRGGGEYGEQWHLAGTKLNKQNVFDDFIAAAAWLVQHRYTCPAKLAIGGRSNGGLLVGACLTQRPDLYGATLPGVGVMDMLRFHKFTIGWAWTSDYGSSDNAEEFKALLAYSPLHRLKPGGRYPPTLITTADHDDRVVPAHSFKFAAALQAAQAGDAPVLIRVETRAGHGAGEPTDKLIAETADKWAFLVRALRWQPAGLP